MIKQSELLLVFDVNILIDVLQDRQPWSESASQLLSLCDRGIVRGCWCSASVGTVYFLVKREFGPQRAREAIRELSGVLAVLPLDEAMIQDALLSDWPDLEDAIVHASAQHAGATHLITRDPKGFSKASLPACDVEAILAIVAAVATSAAADPAQRDDG